MKFKEVYYVLFRRKRDAAIELMVVKGKHSMKFTRKVLSNKNYRILFISYYDKIKYLQTAGFDEFLYYLKTTTPFYDRYEKMMEIDLENNYEIIPIDDVPIIEYNREISLKTETEIYLLKKMIENK